MSCYNNSSTNNNSCSANNGSQGQEMGDPGKPHTWMKDVHDLPRTVGLFSIIYAIYLVGRVVVGYLTHLQKLRKIRAEKTAKCAKCTEAESRTRELELRLQLAELSAQEANSRAEQFAQRERDANERAEVLQRRAGQAEVREGDRRSFRFSAHRVEPMADPRYPESTTSSSGHDQNLFQRLGGSISRLHRKGETLKSGKQGNRQRG
ncbi:hypothetical protein PITC_003360 [Penicillium italicum]|uniref:Uncharacterized protein n=1 Tax=Penicillium italicum TaxID=40296 RepID=A0A0A2KZ81_PENIT|nr:hypothetical protein PITC_003360 [Penicillium italicum]